LIDGQVAELGAIQRTDEGQQALGLRIKCGHGEDRFEITFGAISLMRFAAGIQNGTT
jgi:hypothetical protein